MDHGSRAVRALNRRPTWRERRRRRRRRKEIWIALLGTVADENVANCQSVVRIAGLAVIKAFRHLSGRYCIRTVWIGKCIRRNWLTSRRGCGGQMGYTEQQGCPKRAAIQIWFLQIDLVVVLTMLSLGRRVERLAAVVC
jgi:hypothetical protein